MYNADENELLHELDDLQRQVKALKEENVRLRSSTPIVANIEVNSNEIEEIKNKFKVVYKALELACKQITYLDCDGSCDLFEDCKTPCSTCDCGEHDLWVDFYLKKAGEKNEDINT